MSRASDWAKKQMQSAYDENDAFYNADSVIADFNLVDFIRRCGYELVRDEMLCPKGHDSKTKSFKINKANPHLFKCFGASCGWTGNVITFAKFINGSESYKPAVELIRGHKPLAKIVNKPKPQIQPAVKEIQIDYLQNKKLALQYIKNLTNNSPVYKYLLKRGLIEQTIRAYGLGADKNNLAMPIFDIRNKIVGFKYRSIKDKKYWFSKGLNKSNYLYSLRSLQYIRQAKAVYLLEGEIDAISLYQVGFRNCLSIMGGDFNENQMNLIRPFIQKIIILPDNDLAGLEVVKRIKDVAKDVDTEAKLLNYNDFKPCKDPNDLLVRGKLLEAMKMLGENPQN